MKPRRMWKKARTASALMLVALMAFGCEWEDRSSADGGQQPTAVDDVPVPDPPLEAVREEVVEIVAPIDDADTRSETYRQLAFRHVDDEPTDHMAVARQHIADGDRAAAMVELGKALYDDPDSYAAALLLGKTAWRTGELELSKKAFELATETDPAQVDAWIQLGRLALVEKRTDEAIDLARHVMTIDPKRPESHNLQGRVWLARSHWHRAVLSFKKAVALSPDSLFYRNNLGLAYLLKKDFGKAVEVLEGLSGRKDVPAFMLNNLGLAFEGAGLLHEAMQSFKQAVDVSPRYVNAKINLGRLTALAQRQEELEAEPAALEEPLATPDSESDDLIIAEPEDF